jgi:hypothetical protein
LSICFWNLVHPSKQWAWSIKNKCPSHPGLHLFSIQWQQARRP